MGKIFGDLEYATPSHLYAGAPVEEIKALNAQKSKDYTETRGTKDALDVAIGNLDVRDIDYGTKKKYLDDLKGRFQETVDKGDWQNAKYQIADEVKKFSTDSVLKAAQSAKQQKDIYNRTLKDNYDKGDLSEEHMNYASKKSKDEAIGLDSEGKITGGFGGRKILNDKKIRADIYKEADDRIKDWKADEILRANGKEYTNAGHGQYFVEGSDKTVSAEEVRQALTNEIKAKHGDFLQQEKEVDFDNLTNGENRLINFEDFKKLGYTNNTGKPIDSLSEIAYASNKIDPETIQKLKQSKDPNLKQEGFDLENKVKNTAKQLQDPIIQHRALNNLYDNHQINKYTQGATDKASFLEQKANWQINHQTIEDIKLENDEKKTKFENELKKSGIVPITGNSELETYTASDLNLTEGKIQEKKTELQDKQNFLNKIMNDPARQREAENLQLQIKSLQNDIKTNINNKADAIDQLAITNPGVQTSFIAHSLIGKNNEQGLVSYILQNQKDFSPLTIKEALNLNKNMSNSIINRLDKTKNNNFNYQEEIDKEDFKKLSNAINIDKNKNALIKKAVEIVDSKGENINNLHFKGGTKAGEMGGWLDLNEEDSSINYPNPNSLFSKTIENNEAPIVEQSKTVYGIDRNTDISSKENNAIELITDLVKNGKSTFTKDGLTSDKYISNLMKNGDLKDAAGNKLKEYDANKIEVNPVINHFTGMAQARITIPNAYKEGKEGQLVSANFDVDSADPSTIEAYFNQVGDEQLHSSSPEGQQKGIEIKSFLKYGKDLSRLNTTKKRGLEAYREISVGNTKAELKIIKQKGQEGINVLYKDKTGNYTPLQGLSFDNKTINNGEYSSIQELQQSLFKRFDTK
jgi:hypothetical protein